MPVLRSNVDYIRSVDAPRDKRQYGYGGCWVRNDVTRTTDCSGIVTHQLDGLINGVRMAFSRHGLSTEAYRYVGGPGSRGPFGTIRVAAPRDIPGDAALRIGLHHGPGGGANSHMACTLEGVAIESSGSYGQRIGGPARGYDHPYFHDWFFLPGPIAGAGGTVDVPILPPGIVYLGITYENHGARVLALQQRLNRDYYAYSNLVEDGEFGPATDAVVRIFQRRAGLVADGIAGPATLTKLGLPTS